MTSDQDFEEFKRKSRRAQIRIKTLMSWESADQYLEALRPSHGQVFFFLPRYFLMDKKQVETKAGRDKVKTESNRRLSGDRDSAPIHKFSQ